MNCHLKAHLHDSIRIECNANKVRHSPIKTPIISECVCALGESFVSAVRVLLYGGNPNKSQQSTGAQAYSSEQQSVTAEVVKRQLDGNSNQ